MLSPDKYPQKHGDHLTLTVAVEVKINIKNNKIYIKKKQH